MLNSSKKFTKAIPSDNSGHIPNDIKVHMENKIKVVPNENKSHLGNTSRCRIVPNEKIPDMESELRNIGISLDSGKKIKIVPPVKK